MIRSFRVLETTDRQYVGCTISIDDESIPGSVTMQDGDELHIDVIENLGGGMFRVSNTNYIAYISEVSA